MKFTLGQIVITPKAGELLRHAGHTPQELLVRHQSGDWGDVTDDERRLNEEGLTKPLNLVSNYKLPSGQTIMVYTKADRSVTMLHISPAREAVNGSE